MTTDPEHFDRESTPVQSKAAHSTEAQFGYTEAQRQAALLDAEQSAQLVDMPYFMQTVLPHVTPSTIAQVTEKLKTGRRHMICKTGRLRGFPADPHVSGRNEAGTFRALDAVINAIIEAASPVQPPQLRYSSNPNMIPLFAERESTSRPDGGLLLRGRKLAWTDMACAAEVKKSETDDTVRDNIKKIVWSMTQIMRDDARRRACFGFTIENVTMRLWFGSRQVLYVSPVFNFIIEHEYLIHFFVALASAEEYELGWDPTMTRLSKGQFDVQVRTEHGKTVIYRTEQLLSSHAAEAMLSRGSRVHSARRLVNGQPSGDLVVLKDTWIDADRDREGEILKTIERLANQDGLRGFDEYFLKVLAHGDVFIQDAKGNLIKDDTQLILHGGSAPIEAKKFDLKTKPPLKKDAEPALGYHYFCAGQDKSEDFLTPPVIRGKKVHYRIVFAQVCKPIFVLRSLEQIVKAVAQLGSPLSLLHSLHWVHRDISISNILVDSKGRVKLCDVEYAIWMDTNSEVHKIRTGRLPSFFMEVAIRRHQYYTQANSKRPSCRYDDDQYDEYAMAQAAICTGSDFDPPSDDTGTRHYGHNLELDLPSSSQSGLTESGRAPFQYHPLHDLESLWWVIAYFAFEREREEATEAESEILRTAAHRVFTQRPTMFFGHQGEFADCCRSLPNCLQPLGRLLEVWRREFCATYQLMESKPRSVGHTLAKTLRKQFVSALHSHAPRLAGIKIKPCTPPWGLREEGTATSTDQSASSNVDLSNLNDAQRVDDDCLDCANALERLPSNAEQEAEEAPDGMEGVCAAVHECRRDAARG
ncbi:hypothetical protein NM688_g5671 [Phlebia brevispora]|uniref:Uncharacterized protein n=1 Tax=Phlebia brevispora TaxID=194682 RepID=A0ACC1SRI4_9APHY|nr:hypothetical protein NM688_g5671 [Phlebia brevispora]